MITVAGLHDPVEVVRVGAAAERARELLTCIAGAGAGRELPCSP